ncbi:MAG: arabinogalactan endo-1,4-beta-galactosidase [Kiritimatiellae bacterium]|nr:arabinogalactan endo-1,4-beta-galactosidase [Kiritimatiellia bacterium]
MKLSSLLTAAAIAYASLHCAAAPDFAKGADLSWTTELESRGYRWRNAAGVEMECFALMKSIGFNAVRLRVWVEPDGGRNSGGDLLEKARRAAKLQLPVMIDFHYSGTWADPGKQFKPDAWRELGRDALAKAVGMHTESTLEAVKSTGADIAWVQIGNETRPGLLWDADASKSGALRDVDRDGRRLAAKNAENFALFLNAGAGAVRKACANAKIIVHCDHGHKWGDLEGMLEAARGVDYDIFGVSLYPAGDWRAQIRDCAANLERIREECGKDTMVCEFGMPTHPLDAAHDATEALLRTMRRTHGCRGVFYWEPEAFPQLGYKMGASTLDGKTATPSPALAPFAAGGE